MSQEAISTAPLAPTARPSWSQTWWLALTRPTVATYAGFASDPRAARNTAYGWVSRMGLVAGLVLGATEFFTPGGEPIAMFGAMCLGPVLAALFALLGFAIQAGLSQFIARAMGGTGSYDQLAYATAAYFAPALLIATVAGMTPFPLLLTIPLWLYQLILNTVAVKAAHRLSWRRAAIPSVIFGTFNAILFACLLVILLAGALSQPGL
jgi:hypothetical protein